MHAFSVEDAVWPYGRVRCPRRARLEARDEAAVDRSPYDLVERHDLLALDDGRHEQRAARCAVRLLPHRIEQDGFVHFCLLLFFPKKWTHGGERNKARHAPVAAPAAEITPPGGLTSRPVGVSGLDPRGSHPQTPGGPDSKPPGIPTLNPRGARLRASSGPRSVPLSVSLSCSVFLSCFCLLRRAEGSPPYRRFAHPW